MQFHSSYKCAELNFFKREKEGGWESSEVSDFKVLSAAQDQLRWLYEKARVKEREK